MTPEEMLRVRLIVDLAYAAGALSSAPGSAIDTAATSTWESVISHMDVLQGEVTGG